MTTFNHSTTGTFSNSSQLILNCIFLHRPINEGFLVIINGFFTLLVSIVGSVGNLYALRYLMKATIGGSTICRTLKYLSCWDTALLLVALMSYSLKEIAHWAGDFRLSSQLAVISAVLYPCSVMSYRMSNWLVALMSIQRYAAIAQPFSRRSLSLSRGNLHCSAPLALSLITIAVSLPSCFELRPQQCITASGHLLMEARPTDLRLNFYYKLFRGFFNAIFVSVGPFTCVLITGLGVMRVIHGASRTRTQISAARRMSSTLRFMIRDKATGTVLYLLTIKFLITHLLPVILDLWELTKYKQTLKAFKAFYYVLVVSNFFVVLNSATNCLVYMLAGKLSRLFVVAKMSKARRLSTSFPFTRSEIRMLQDSFQSVWQDAYLYGSRFDCLSKHMLLELLHLKPELCYFLSMDPEDEESWNNHPRAEEMSAKINLFFHQLVLQDMETRNLSLLKTRIAQTTNVHREIGIVMRPDMWKMMKKIVVYAAERANAGYGAGDCLAVKAWSKFISFVIGDMRNCFIEYHPVRTASNCNIMFDFVDTNKMAAVSLLNGQQTML